MQPSAGSPQAPPPAARPYYPPPPPRGANVTLWVVVGLVALIIIGFFVTVIVGMAMFTQLALTEVERPGPKVAVVPIEGVIMSGSPSGFGSSDTTAESVISTLRSLEKNADVKAVVLRVNSPGGSAAASQEIYAEVQRIDQTKPVIVSMGDVAASGGYYVSAAAREIYADPATITGSIGVIFQGLNIRDLLDKIGVEADVITSGRLKDIGSPFRAMTDEERRLLQGMLDDVHDQFIEAVAAGREMDRAEVTRLADGRLFTGREAMALGLVDQTGGLRDAIRRAGDLGGISGEPRAVMYSGGNLFDALFGPPPELHPFLLLYNPLAARARQLMQ